MLSYHFLQYFHLIHLTSHKLLHVHFVGILQEGWSLWKFLLWTFFSHFLFKLTLHRFKSSMIISLCCLNRFMSCKFTSCFYTTFKNRICNEHMAKGMNRNSFLFNTSFFGIQFNSFIKASTISIFLTVFVFKKKIIRFTSLFFNIVLYFICEII